MFVRCAVGAKKNFNKQFLLDRRVTVHKSVENQKSEIATRIFGDRYKATYEAFALFHCGTVPRTVLVPFL